MSAVATLIADMVRAGVDPDLIGRTAELLANDDQAERRRASDRERKRASRASAMSAESADTPRPPALDKENPPAPPEEIKPTPLTPQAALLGERVNDEKSDLESLTDRLIEAAGEKIQPHGAIVLAPILGLLDAGCDLETDILPTIRARTSKMARPAGSWAYFVDAIRDAHAARIEAGRGIVKPPGPEDMEKRWQTRLKAARRRGQWSTAEWGPAPGQPGSIVPKHLLQPGDGEGWREWQSEAA